jgi:hypothetical protein
MKKLLIFLIILELNVRSNALYLSLLNFKYHGSYKMNKLVINEKKDDSIYGAEFLFNNKKKKKIVSKIENKSSDMDQNSFQGMKIKSISCKCIF